MTSLILLGFIIGMRHALEADHIAAVASLATKKSTIKQTAWQGAVWGIGHTITLFIFGSAVLLMETVIPEQLAHNLEFIVGIMLVLLGLDVIRRLIKDRIHYHIHSHDNEQHFHAHTHSNKGDHKNSDHQHNHSPFPFRALFVGLMHGMAGSAALILLTLDTVTSIWQGIIYILLFGIGSIVGMAVLSFVISIPLRSSAKGLTWLHNSLQTAIGVFTIGLGGSIMYQII